jgi:type IV secretory pathway VirB4 component
MRYVLDAEEDGMRNSDLQLFEMKKLIEQDDQRLTVPVITLLMHRIRRGAGKGHHTRFTVDEFQDYGKHEAIAPHLEQFVDKSRKDDAGLRIATLGISRLLECAIAPALLSAIKSWILLPDATLVPGSAAARLLMDNVPGVTEEVCHLLSAPAREGGLTPRKHAVLVQDGHTTVFSPALSPAESIIYGATSGQLRADATRLADASPDTSWVPQLLRKYGCRDAADRYDYHAQRYTRTQSTEDAA